MNALRFVPLLVIVVLAAFANPAPASADTVPFSSYSVDEQGAVIGLNPAYLPVRLFGSDLPPKADGKPDGFKYPEDVFVDGKDRIYIADRGNDRIVEFDENGAFSRYIGHLPGKGKLKAPEGVFVDPEGTIYVADTGNSRIVRYSPQGELLREYTAPDSDYLPKDYRFVPSKIVVDSRNLLYVVSKGSYQGMLQLGQNNEFLSFYGKNRVKLSPVERLQRLFYTKEQREKLSDVLPGSITNVTINAQGFLYTTTMSIDTEQIKKLNYAGQNILPEKEFFVPAPAKSGPAVASYLFRDVAVSPQGMITAIDAKTNTILQYDAQGKLLYTFAGEDDRVLRIGKLKSPSGLALTSKGDLLVTDNTTNLVHLLRPTPFSQLVLEATSLYAAGKYEQSEEPWRRVLQLNESYSRAHLGLAKLSFKRGDWETSMAEYKQALDGQGYSEAFWQVRMLWLQKRFTLIALALVSLAAAVWLVRRVIERRFPAAAHGRGPIPGRGLSRLGAASIGREAVLFGSVLKRPLAVFEELRDSKTGSWTFGFLVLAGVLLSRLGEALFTGFVFHPVPAHLADPLRIGVVLLVPLLSWVLCNYLVSTLNRGEGTFKDVFVGTMYALAPYALFTLPLALFSNGLTASEGVIYHFMQKAVFVWTALLLVFKVQVIHNYDVKETVVNVLLTLATIVVLWFAVFVHVTLSFDLRDFAAKLWEELIYRG